ncbi:MAG: Holliday junction resolvase RuvX [Tannerella sp.]|jgi:putative Holliday junction resolvase|nr:Holliday junction resolvase RuvX [Tannerella sp.]
MGRILAIDYGRKRTGLAVTDTMQIIAGGLCTVRTCDVEAYLKDYLSRETVDLFVVGQPKTMNNEPSDNMPYIEAFVKRLRKILPDTPVEYFDERFTSVMAHRAMLDAGLKKMKRRDKELVDEISAVLILQGFMEKKRLLSL